jgi:SNF2 family DNA or RNA helicase
LSNQVLQLHGFEVLEYHGGMTQQQRNKVLRRFRSNDGSTPRILLLSNVGAIGLNLDIANIVIIIVGNFTWGQDNKADLGC